VVLRTKTISSGDLAPTEEGDDEDEEL